MYAGSEYKGGMGWVAHHLWPIFTFVALRLGYALVRAYLKQDPSDWAVQRLRISHPDRWAEVLRWALITAAVGMIWGATWFIPMLGPHEGDPADAPFTSQDFNFVAHDNRYGRPGVNVTFTPTRAFTGCTIGTLLWPTVEIPSANLTENFRLLIAENDLRSTQECNIHYQTGRPTVTTAFPESSSVLDDSPIKEILGGTRNLYAMFVWKYYLDDAPKAYFITEACVIFSGQSVMPEVCPGNFGGTWRHFAK